MARYYQGLSTIPRLFFSYLPYYQGLENITVFGGEVYASQLLCWQPLTVAL